MRSSIVIIVLIILTYLIFVESYKVERSKIDGNKYFVLPYSNSQSAADILARVNINVAKLIEHLKIKYGKKHTIVKNLCRRYNPDAIYEHQPKSFDNVAYTMGKGKSVYICLRKIYGDQKKLHNFNTIMFVVLHEISHIATDVIKHPDEFWITFKFILKEAVSIGIYQPIDYSVHNESYCREMIINYSPLFDKTLDESKFYSI